MYKHYIWKTRNQALFDKIEIRNHRFAYYLKRNRWNNGLGKKYLQYLRFTKGFPGGASGKEPTCNAEHMRPGFDPWVGTIPWRREWQPIPVFLPRESHGQRSLVGYSPWSYKESDTTETTWHACKIYCIYVKVKVKITQSCSTLSNSMDYTVHGILQARILEWVTFPFSRGSSQPRDRTQVPLIAGGFFTSWATSEA